MPIEEVFGNYFKSEIKTSGRKLLAQEKISVASATDTEIQAYVRVTPPFKVRLSSAGIGHDAFTADCNCPMAKKSQFCKHVWATLLNVETRYPDFLSAKHSIAKPAASDEAGEPARERSQTQSAYQATAKARAAEYRKEQYQKQKARAKEKKRGSGEGKASKLKSAYPPELETALVYFAENGFPMNAGPSESVLLEAKRKLSRVFHPDRGGSNDEMVELNKNCELVSRFL